MAQIWTKKMLRLWIATIGEHWVHYTKSVFTFRLLVLPTNYLLLAIFNMSTGQMCFSHHFHVLPWFYQQISQNTGAYPNVRGRITGMIILSTTISNMECCRSKKWLCTWLNVHQHNSSYNNIVQSAFSQLISALQNGGGKNYNWPRMKCLGSWWCEKHMDQASLWKEQKLQDVCTWLFKLLCLWKLLLNLEQRWDRLKSTLHCKYSA